MPTLRTAWSPLISGLLALAPLDSESGTLKIDADIEPSIEVEVLRPDPVERRREGGLRVSFPVSLIVRANVFYAIRTSGGPQFPADIRLEPLSLSDGTAESLPTSEVGRVHASEIPRPPDGPEVDVWVICTVGPSRV